MNNLIIITSVINISKDPLNYTKTRSVYTPKERYEQTIKTIESCKMIPNSEIVFIETSNIDSQKEEKIKSLVDNYFNFKDNEYIKKIIDGTVKGAAEATQISECIKLLNIDEYKNIFKISGRYWFSESFDFDKYNNLDSVFLEGPNKTALATVMYKVNNKHFSLYKETIEYCRKSSGMLEKDFVKFFKDKCITYPKIGVAGNVSVDGNYIDW